MYGMDTLRVLGSLVVAAALLLGLAAAIGRSFSALSWSSLGRAWSKSSPVQRVGLGLLPLLGLAVAVWLITTSDAARPKFVALLSMELSLIWAGLVGAALLAAVVGIPALVLRLVLPRTWAVARLTLAEAIRMKVALFFVVLMVLGFWGGSQGQGDGTLTGRVQAFLAYSVTTVTVLASLLSIFLSRSLSDELVHRQMIVAMSKPVPRWEYLLGKWFGIVLLNAGLMTVAGAGIYATAVNYLARQPALNEYDRGRLDNEVLTARYGTPFAVPDHTREVNQLFDRNLEAGKYDAMENFDADAEKARLKKYLDIRWRAVPPEDYREFRFNNVLCDRSADSWVNIRYKAEANRYPPDEVLRSVWMVGDPSKDGRVYQTPRRDVGDRFHTISVPADAVSEDSTLLVRFWNINPYEGEPPNDYMFLFEGPRAVELLFSVGTFGGNLVRLLLLAQCKLMFLAAVALLFATVFSFPVACLCSMTVYALAATRSFLGDSFDMLDDEGALGAFKEIFSWVLKALYLAVPDFSKYSATDFLVEGRNVTLAWVLSGVIHLAMIATVLSLLLGCVLFYRREVSEASV
ncbi:MAG: ABC transporter permease [Phycisphaerae bacterium]